MANTKINIEIDGFEQKVRAVEALASRLHEAVGMADDALSRLEKSAGRVAALEAEAELVGEILGAQQCDTNAQRAREVMGVLKDVLKGARHLGIHADSA